MFPTTQPSIVIPLHGRNVLAPVNPSFTTDKEPQGGDSRDTASPPTQPLLSNGNDHHTDVVVVNIADNAAGCAFPTSQSITPVVRARDQICFQHLVTVASAAAVVALICVTCVWRATSSASIDPSTGQVIPYTFQYFIYCFLGGVVAGTVHVAVTPIDVVKCRLQVGEYRSFKEGFLHLYYAEAGGSVLRVLPLFFRGWIPTAWGYCTQGALKFSLYEVFKYVLLIAPRDRRNAELMALNPLDPPSKSIYDWGVFQVVVFLLSSSLAEIVADLGLAPWEAVKIRMQTSPTFSASLRSALPRMWEAEGLHGFYKGLVPLWCRQVPYTMMKFASFEMIVVSLASVLHAVGLHNPDRPSTLSKLFVSLTAGMLAGVLCGLVSHPADTVLSRLNQKSNAAGSSSGGIGGHPGGSSGTLHDIVTLVHDLGWKGLWKGLVPRLLMVSTLTALQWVTYDGFKVFVGLPTSGDAKH